MTIEMEDHEEMKRLLYDAQWFSHFMHKSDSMEVLTELANYVGKRYSNEPKDESPKEETTEDEGIEYGTDA